MRAMSKEDRLLPLEDDVELGKRQFPSSLTSLCDFFPRRFKVAGICLFITLNIFLAGTLLNLRILNLPYSYTFGGGGGEDTINIDDIKLHVVIPASHSDVNICKLILGCSLLGYPNPTLLSWGETFDRPDLLAGGSHLAKVSGALEYLNSLRPDQDDELFLTLDAYDVHMQLPRSVLLRRYFATREAAQRRLVASDSSAAKENLRQLVLFGAGKRCAPNWPHTVACYAIPDSPLPPDLYGADTDTVVGHNQWSSARQRYLNSGYVIGPVGAMRRLFGEAWQIIGEGTEKDKEREREKEKGNDSNGGGKNDDDDGDDDPLDDGSHYGTEAYHGSDQSVFADMYGRQEWAREKLRLKHAPRGTRPRTSQVLGSLIDNVLAPSFTHEAFDPDLSEGNPYEFGIYLDFWSQLGHQTINSEWDARWITYENRTTSAKQEKEKEKKEGEKEEEGAVEEEDHEVGVRTAFDCPVKIPAALPDDILDSRLPTESDDASSSSSSSSSSVSEDSSASPWLTRPLYTHLCLSQIPVFRHMNGPKEHREQDWPKIWYQPRARAMLGELRRSLEERQHHHQQQPPPRNQTWQGHKADPGLRVAGGAWTDKGVLLGWEQLCPSEYDREIFRDV